MGHISIGSHFHITPASPTRRGKALGLQLRDGLCLPLPHQRVEPMLSCDAFHARSGNDKTNMVRQRQDKTKLIEPCSSFVLSDGRRGGCRGGLPAAGLSDTGRQSTTDGLLSALSVTEV